MPLVSIIIPCFNRKNLLEATLISFQNQTIEDFEAIVVDGGSTDGTVEFVKRFCRSDARFKLIQKPANAIVGPSPSRNLAIKEAKGQYICFSDDDDLQHAESIERRLMPLLADKTLLYCSCNKLNFTDDKELGKEVMLNKTNFGRFSLKNIKEYVDGKIWINTAGPLIRADFFKSNKYLEDLYYGDDWEFNLRLLASGEGLMLPDRLIYHRFHPNSTTINVKNNLQRFESGLRARIYGYEYLKSQNLLTGELIKSFSSYFSRNATLKYLFKFLEVSSNEVSTIKILVFFFIRKVGLKRLLN